jgi:hypothetical protein
VDIVDQEDMSSKKNRVAERVAADKVAADRVDREDKGDKNVVMVVQTDMKNSQDMT